MTDYDPLDSNAPQNKSNKTFTGLAILSAIVCVWLMFFSALTLPKPIDISANMLETTTTTAQNPAGSAPLSFDSNVISEGTAIQHEEGSGLLTLTQPGFYNISYSVSGNTTSANTTNEVSLFLVMDGEQLPDSVVKTRTNSTDQTFTLSAATVVEISQEQISWFLLQNEFSGVIYTHASLYISQIR